jgi:hypothetical protein
MKTIPLNCPLCGMSPHRGSKWSVRCRTLTCKNNHQRIPMAMWNAMARATDRPCYEKCRTCSVLFEWHEDNTAYECASCNTIAYRKYLETLTWKND